LIEQAFMSTRAKRSKAIQPEAQGLLVKAQKEKRAKKRQKLRAARANALTANEQADEQQQLHNLDFVMNNLILFSGMRLFLRESQQESALVCFKAMVHFREFANTMSPSERLSLVPASLLQPEDTRTNIH
jgi:hypothetical protein